MKAALEGQKAVFLHNVGTLIVQSLHVASIKIKFKLSSSQEPSKCLFHLYGNDFKNGKQFNFILLLCFNVGEENLGQN